MRSRTQPRLAWSQPTRPRDDRPRNVLLVAVLCLFLGGVVVGAGGRDLQHAPRAVRAAFASLLTMGAALFVIGLALLAVRKSRKSGAARLTLAAPGESRPGDTERHFGQEERR